MSIAQTILAQFGGNKFLAMTGARNLLNTGDGLQFDLPRGFATNKATKVRVSLLPSDTYRVEFFKWNARKFTCDLLASFGDVCADDLARVFTSSTGLDCRL